MLRVSVCTQKPLQPVYGWRRPRFVASSVSRHRWPVGCSAPRAEGGAFQETAALQASGAELPRARPPSDDLPRARRGCAQRQSHTRTTSPAVVSLASIVREDWCWRNKSLELDVLEEDVSGVEFRQTGYMLRCSLSHAITLVGTNTRPFTIALLSHPVHLPSWSNPPTQPPSSYPSFRRAVLIRCQPTYARCAAEM